MGEAEVQKKIMEFVKNLGKETEIMPYAYNRKEFIPGISPVYYSGPFFDENEIVGAIQTMLTGTWLAAGEEVGRFEKEYAAKFGQKHAVMLNSGSSANLVMIAALKKVLKWEDDGTPEVILSTVGFPTTLSALMINNIKPVFVDIEFDTLNFDLNLIEQKITPKTKAIFLSPVLGNPCDIDRLVEICKKYKIELILDGCDSVGTLWKSKNLCDYAITTSVSFYPAHHMSTFGQGGMVTSNSNKIIATCESIATWGRGCNCRGTENLLSCGTCGKRFSNWIKEVDNPIDHKYYFTNIGYNLKPLDLQGKVGQEQLKKFDEIHKKRIHSKNEIQKIFERVLPEVRVINELPHASTSWFGTPIVCPNKEYKVKIVAHLEANRIQTRNYFAGNILLHPAYSHLDDYRKYPEANKVLELVFFIGASPHYGKDVFDYIETVLKKFQP